MVDKRSPSGGFWALVTVVLPLLNVLITGLDIAIWEAAGVVAFFGVLSLVLTIELAAVRRWLLREHVDPARWITLAGALIVAETGIVVVLLVHAIVAATGD